MSYRATFADKPGIGAYVVNYDKEQNIQNAKAYGGGEKSAMHWTNVEQIRKMSDNSVVMLGVSNSSLFLDGVESLMPTTKGTRAFIKRYAPKQIKINFGTSTGAIKPGDVELPDSFMYQYGSGMEVVPPETRENYDFVGWYLDEALTMPFREENLDFTSGEITLYPKWVEKSPKPTEPEKPAEPDVNNPETLDKINKVAKTGAVATVILLGLFFLLKRRR